MSGEERRKRLEKLAAAMVEEIQKRSGNREQINPYMANLANPGMLELYSEYKKKAGNGDYPLSDMDRTMFELCILNERAVKRLEQRYLSKKEG